MECVCFLFLNYCHFLIKCKLSCHVKNLEKNSFIRICISFFIYCPQPSLILTSNSTAAKSPNFGTDREINCIFLKHFAFYYRKLQQISRTRRKAAPQVWELKFWNKIWKEIKINQKWSLKKDASYVHSLFPLKVSN